MCAGACGRQVIGKLQTWPLSLSVDCHRPDIHPLPFVLLLSHKADTLFTVPRRMTGWVDTGSPCPKLHITAAFGTTQNCLQRGFDPGTYRATVRCCTTTTPLRTTKEKTHAERSKSHLFARPAACIGRKMSSGDQLQRNIHRFTLYNNTQLQTDTQNEKVSNGWKHKAPQRKC